MNHSGVLVEIARAIYEIFPGVQVEFEYVEQTGETFILIDSAHVYSSEKYQALISDVKTRLLWPKGHHDVYFGIADEGQDFGAISYSHGVHLGYLSYQFGTDMTYYNWTGAAFAPPDLSKAA
jgi:hypothetical protein